MVTHIKGNLLNSECDYVCHQVNCQGRMGAGLAMTIRNWFPEVYDSYIELCRNEHLKPEDLLGTIDIVGVNDAPYDVISIFGQMNYGYDGTQYTSYVAFGHALEQIKEFIPEGSKIGFPKNIGCGLGGGNWTVIYNMIAAILGGKFDVYIYEL